MNSSSQLIHFRCRQHRQSVQRLCQVARTDEGTVASRPIEGEHQKGLRPGGWVVEARQLKSGLYCQQCLEDGNLEPLADYDEIDLSEAGLNDTPHIGLSAADFDLDCAWENVQKEFSDLVIATRERKASPARTDSRLRRNKRIDSHLHRAVSSKLGARDLYCHQVDAIEAALDGRDVMIETATASGKSMSYWVPVLNTLVGDGEATAFYIAPTNALAEDQLNVLDSLGSKPLAHTQPGTYPQCVREVKIGPQSILAARYDGTIKDEELRRLIRKSCPRILITNPDTLHHAVLPHHERIWQYFFSNLRFVIVDEFHVYKGMFGANFANIMRRVQRLALHYGLRPQIMGCSASIGNPSELFTAVTGRSAPVLISASSSAPRYIVSGAPFSI